MKRQTAKWLHDAVSACQEARLFCASSTRDEFLGNRMLQLAIQKLIEIVGEALHQAEVSDPEAIATIPELRSVVNTRNRLIHGYDTVDFGALWDIVQRHIPALEQQLMELLSHTPPLIITDSSDGSG